PAPSNVWTPHPRQCPLTGPKSHSKTFEAPRKAPPLLGGLGSYPPHRAAQNESTRREQDLGYRRHQPGRTQKHRGQRGTSSPGPTGTRPPGGAFARLSRELVLLAPPVPAPCQGRLPGRGPRPTRLRPQ